MARNSVLILVLFLAAAQSAPGGAMAQSALSGQVGVDLETYDFENHIAGTERDFAVDRAISNHFVDLRLEGPLISPELLQFDARTLFRGTNYHVASDAEETNAYFRPGVPTYHGALSLFPARSYPLRLYVTRARDNSIRYEAQNRSKIDLVSPELAVVRRYQTDIGSNGIQWKLGLSEGADFGAEVKQDRAKITRQFDFREDLDIWVDLLTIRPDPTASEHRVGLINEVPDDTLLVFIDLVQVDAVLPGQSIEFDLEHGVHDLEIVPKRFNPYRSEVDVQGDMRWRVIHTPPAGSSDLDQTTDVVRATLNLGNTGPFRNDTYFESNDTEETVQIRTTTLTNFSNTASYALSRFSGLDVLTTYSQNDTEIDTISAQLNKSFLQQNTLRLGTAGGLLTQLSYSYNWIAAKTTVDDFESRSHILGASQTVPVPFWSTVLDWRNTATLSGDNRGYVNDQYSSDLTATAGMRYLGVDWQPRQQVKYTHSEQKQPDNMAKEVELRSMLSGEVPRVGFLGSVKVKGEYSLRRKDVGSEIDRKNRYLAELLITRKFGAGSRILLNVVQEKETHGTDEVRSASVGGGEEEAAIRVRVNPAREDQIKQSYKIDVLLAPVPALSLGANAMMMKQNKTTITRTGLSVNGKIPGISLPIRWFILSEGRELEGLPKQTNFVMETKLSYRFRQIALILSHRTVSESLITEKYGFQELRAEVSRQFTAF